MIAVPGQQVARLVHIAAGTAVIAGTLGVHVLQTLAGGLAPADPWRLQTMSIPADHRPSYDGEPPELLNSRL